MSWIPKIICVHWNQLEINVYIHIYIYFLYLSLLPICMLKPSCNRFIHTSVFHQILQVVSGWTLIPRISPSRKFQQKSCHLKSAFQLFSDVCFFFSAIFVYFPSTPPNIYQSTTSGYPPNFWIKKHNTTGGAFNLFKNIKKNRIIVKLSSSSPIFP